MSAIEARLKSLGFQLPESPAPGGNYVPFAVQDSFVFLAGVISTWNGAVITGTVGADKSIQDGYEAARACALVQLANLKVALGDLDRVDRILSLNGYVNAVPGFGVSPGNKRCFRSSGGAFWLSRATRPCGDWGIGAAEECAGRDSVGGCCAAMTVPATQV